MLLLHARARHVLRGPRCIGCDGGPAENVLGATTSDLEARPVPKESRVGQKGSRFLERILKEVSWTPKDLVTGRSVGAFSTFI